MSIYRRLQALLDYYTRSRQVGHTTAMMRATSATQPTAVLAINHRHVEQLRDCVAPGHDVEFITLEELARGTYISRRERPLLIDNYTAMEICRGSLEALDSAVKTNAELERQLQEANRTISSLKSTIGHLETQIACNLEHQIEHAAATLPLDWQFRIDVENGNACVTVIRPDKTEECMSDGEAGIAEEFSYAFEYLADELEAAKNAHPQADH